ncbi:MAG: hypothetical protein SOR94_05800 [Lawsonella sp.]|uniref:hypothetical protein n=1 Tax=Lawsonella sp. TaxID=2041415 RepID=UPI002A7483F7|nr:hypothetical protein [Lawsonella sp.]MDY2979531.1 hypothetical protein [Lawsonella sp.]
MRESAAEGAALVPLGDPQAGTPTHTNHGTLQPVNESGPKGRQQGQGKPSKRQLDEEFDKFWSHVAKKRGKQQARRTFERQRRTHTLEFMCSQIDRAQAEWVRTGRAPEYWPHPSTWLNAQLEDDYEHVAIPSQRELYESQLEAFGREWEARQQPHLRAISAGEPLSGEVV